jgi:hypothetical protein
VGGLVITGVFVTVNVCALDAPPPGLGFTTVMDTVPAVATSEAGTAAVSCVDEPNVVVRAEPFQLTVAPETKLLPATVKVKPALPAVIQVGLMEVVAGTGLLIVKVTGFVMVPQLLNVALRVTLYVPVVVGVPEITPVAVFTVRPGGNPVAPYLLTLPPLVVIVYENATPTWPVALPLVMLQAAFAAPALASRRRTNATIFFIGKFG